MHSFPEQSRPIFPAIHERLNMGFMLERPLRDAVFVDLDGFAEQIEQRPS